MGKAVFVGAVLAIVLAAVLGVGAYFYMRVLGGGMDARRQDCVVLILESPAEDGATIAALISLVADGQMLDVSPDTTATIPGTSKNRVRDAFVFGGTAAVARALRQGQVRGPTAYVGVPAAVWRRAVDASGGVTVNMPQKVTVFNGAELVTIPVGRQKLTSTQVAAVLNGQAYLSPAEGTALRHELAVQVAAALVGSGPAADSLKTDLSEASLLVWIQDQLAAAAVVQ
ncbi:MAG: LCP family protein [Coriobacteriia bacterium]